MWGLFRMLCCWTRSDEEMPYLKIRKQSELTGGSQPMDSKETRGPTEIFVNEQTEDKFKCTGYQFSLTREILHVLLCVFTLGLPLLFARWKPKFGVALRRTRAPVSESDLIIIENLYNQCFKIPVITEEINVDAFENDSFFASLLTTNVSFYTIEGPRTRRVRYFIFQHIKYLWDPTSSTFIPLHGLNRNTTCSALVNTFRGFTKEEQMARLRFYGKNETNVQVKSYMELLGDKILDPFYMFQVFSMCLWVTDGYEYFAACIFIITSISIIVELHQTRKQSISLRQMVMVSSAGTVTVYRKSGEIEDIFSSDIVPGDVIVIPPQGCTMVCDAVLIAGNCIVNESMLTGESIPVTKTPLANYDEEDVYCPDMHKRNTLFSGTKVIQTRYYGNEKVVAVVLRTGYSTAKGELIRNILFPKPMGFKFYQDSMRFIGMMFVIAGVGMVYCLCVFIKRGASYGTISRRVLDIVTIVVPPALPAAMSVGSAIAQSVLKKKLIFCINPQRINVAGKLKIICFDKTGTLTEDGLDFWGVYQIENGRFCTNTAVTEVSALDNRNKLLVCMATCHSLTIIGELTGDPLDIKMFQATKWILTETGPDTSRFDTLVPTIVKPITRDSYANADVTIMEQLADEDMEMPYEVGIIRQFEFSSSVQMMSVIVRTLGDKNMEIYAKGAPEKIASVCLPESVPDKYDELLLSYTKQGYRVLALAHKSLDHKVTWHHAQRLKRNQVEADLHLIGLLIMKNALKPETTPIIRTLNDAKIRNVMVTGDNLLTAVSVALDCELISEENEVITVKAIFNDDQSTFPGIEFERGGEAINRRPSLCNGGKRNGGVVCENGNGFLHREEPTCTIINLESPSQSYNFVMDGKAFGILRNYYPELFDKILLRGSVYARMLPQQKAQLVERLQSLGYVVAMVGDGANDCAALKAAHVGMSLSEAEASVAAPFTSRSQDIRCVTTIIKEGRCALVTSFAVFKFMALYSVIQFVSVLMLNTAKTNLGDFHFLYIDLFITTTLSIAIGWTGACPTLSRRRPPGRLLGPVVLSSIIFNIFITTVIQLVAMWWLRQQSWFEPLEDPEPDQKFSVCWETTIVFSVSTFLYIIMALVFSKGRPFRNPIYTNAAMVVLLTILFSLSLVLLVFPGKAISKFMDLSYDKGSNHTDFKLRLLTLPISCLIASLLIEALVDSQKFKSASRFLRRKTQPRNKYKIIELEVAKQPPFLYPVAAAEVDRRDSIT